MANHLHVSGALSENETRELVKASRSGVVGPTALYYAGVTAPAISAAMAVFTSNALGRVGMAENWVNLCASIVAAMAGISWYLIFVRWSNRRKFGRNAELGDNIAIHISERGLTLKHANVETSIAWPGIERIQRDSKHTIVFVEHYRPILIPHTWFNSRETREEFLSALEKGAV